MNAEDRLIDALACCREAFSPSPDLLADLDRKETEIDRGRTRTNRMVVAVAAAVVAVVVGTAAVAGSLDTAGGVSKRRQVAATANPVVLPQGVLASVSLKSYGNPTGLVAAFGSVWVVGNSEPLYRIDPATNVVTATIDLGAPAGCGPIAAGFGRLWLTCGSGAQTIVVDPATDSIVARIPAGAMVTAFDHNSVWMESYPGHKLIRVDPATYQTTATINVRGVDVVAGGGYLWSADDNFPGATHALTAPEYQYHGTVWKIDPATNRVVATIQTPPNQFGAKAIMFFDGAVWIKASDTGTLLRLDVMTGKTTTNSVANFREASGSFLINMVHDGSTIWLRTSDSTISRLDPRTLEPIATYLSDPRSGGGFVALGYGSLWVANFGTDSVWRDRVPA